MTQVEYARCVMMIVKNEETQSNIDEAARILQDVQVETYGSMDHREKVEFILYQMKVMVKKADMIRLLIVSRKVTEKTFKDQRIEDLRVIYYSFYSIYQRHEQLYLDTAQSLKAVFDSLVKGAPELSNLPAVNEFGFSYDPSHVFTQLIFFTAIAEHSAQKTQLLNEFNTVYISHLEKHKHLLDLVRGLLSKELINTSLDHWHIDQAELFSEGYPHAQEHKVDFKKQLIQHNIITCAGYYERVQLGRLAELSGVSGEELEVELCNLVNSDIVKGKIDRIEGVVLFRRQRRDDEILDDWVQDVNSLLDLVNHTCNLIERETEAIAK